MLKEERLNKLVKLVDEHQFMHVEALAKQLGCAQITIRRDILALDLAGRIKKVHGGAKSIRFHDVMDESVEQRQQDHLLEKQMIAKKAATYLKGSHRIYLDAGSSIDCLIDYLEGLDIHVYTHGIHHIPKLLKHGISFSLIGGQVKPQTQVCVGEVAMMQIQMLHFDIAFMGANAYDDSFGFSTPDMSEALIKKTIIKQADRVFVLMDTSKQHKKSHVQFANMEQVTKWIHE